MSITYTHRSHLVNPVRRRWKIDHLRTLAATGRGPYRLWYWNGCLKVLAFGTDNASLYQLVEVLNDRTTTGNHQQAT